MANNKTPIMCLNLVLIFSLLVVTMVDGRTISDVSDTKITESSLTIGTESTKTIVAESTSTTGTKSTPAISTESTPTTDSEATSMVDDVPNTIESISTGAKSTPMMESVPLVTDGSCPTIGGQAPLGIGTQVFIGRKVDNVDDMSREFVETIYAQYNCSAVFVGEVITIADTPHNRRIFTKGNVLPMAPHRVFPMNQVLRIADTPFNGKVFSFVVPKENIIDPQKSLDQQENNDKEA